MDKGTPLLDWNPPVGKFNGADYSPSFDLARLRGQQLVLWNLMQDEKWRTLQEIETTTEIPQASASAQLRHLRKERFGAHTVERRARGDRTQGLFEYRLIVNNGGSQ